MWWRRKAGVVDKRWCEDEVVSERWCEMGLLVSGDARWGCRRAVVQAWGCRRAVVQAWGCIWLFLFVPYTGSFRGSRTISSLLAKTTKFSLLSLVPTSSAVNSANSWNLVKVFRYETVGASSGTLPTA
jgi:hypothetical protein